MYAHTEFEAEVARLIETYYNIADNITAAAASGCRMLQVDPFAAPLRREMDLRERVFGT